MDTNRNPTVVRSYLWRSARKLLLEEEIDHFEVPTGWKRFPDFFGGETKRKFEWFGGVDFGQARLYRFRTKHLTPEEMEKDVMGKLILWKENGVFLKYYVNEYYYRTFFANGLEHDGCICFSDSLLVGLYYGELECLKLCIY